MKSWGPWLFNGGRIVEIGAHHAEIQPNLVGASKPRTWLFQLKTTVEDIQISVVLWFSNRRNLCSPRGAPPSRPPEASALSFYVVSFYADSTLLLFAIHYTVQPNWVQFTRRRRLDRPVGVSVGRPWSTPLGDGKYKNDFPVPWGERFYSIFVNDPTM